jgi:hypothetical protein
MGGCCVDTVYLSNLQTLTYGGECLWGRLLCRYCTRVQSTQSDLWWKLLQMRGCCEDTVQEYTLTYGGECPWGRLQCKILYKSTIYTIWPMVKTALDERLLWRYCTRVQLYTLTYVGECPRGRLQCKILYKSTICTIWPVVKTVSRWKVAVKILYKSTVCTIWPMAKTAFSWDVAV